ncbi:glutamate-5-semialdehyde dehydrogenase [Planctomycetales bacterium ZRK34]|nr:glutamate-5-semialdehyde dehydrogenase [Planctomycetales bacterium ZRK34]
MSTPVQTTPGVDLDAYCYDLADRAVVAGRALTTISGAQRDQALRTIADLLEQRAADIIAANARDIARADEFGLTGAMVDRLRLDEARIKKMAASVRQIAAQTDPVGQVIEGYVRPNGLSIQKVRVPLGVVLFIYESRPNVTSDAAALCIKSANALILRGGKEAIFSNGAIAEVIREALDAAGLPGDAVQLVNTSDRAAVGKLLKLDGQIDVVIPRGGESLIRAVVKQSMIPVIKHYTGNCHVYVDEHAAALGAQQVVDICVNAKVQRPGVCNATESMLFHAEAGDLLKQVATALIAEGIELRGCERTCKLIDGVKPAGEEDWSTEFLDKIVALKVVDTLDEAVAHINRYGSRHTDAILTADVRAADAFVQRVDTANVMVNCSTRFSDGGEYGLGAEIGISTDKLHARGPMGAADMTTYKWVVRGSGQIRN